VATPEGDKQTFSIWRCRTCYTYYLNDWIDRWERTDSLETEERYYRLSPAEALEVLAVIDNVIHAEHPARRHERDAQRDWMLAFLAGHALLSHQIRQGAKIERRREMNTMIVESRPPTVVAARYEEMPFPILQPLQEVAFDLGVTATDRALELRGVVFQGYNDHQLLFEQRWPARVIAQPAGRPT
jgi:hypothetical protein